MKTRGTAHPAAVKPQAPPTTRTARAAQVPADFVTYLCFVVNVPSERNGIVSNLLDVTDGVEAFFIVSCRSDREKKQL